MPLRPITEEYYRGLEETYEVTLPRDGRQALSQAARLGLGPRALSILQQVATRLPVPEPDLYVGPLFGMGPAATVGIGGRPAIVVGADKFDLFDDRGRFPRRIYHPDELVEMVPHEAAHVARMQALGLSPTPRRLTLLDMVILEGTALTFTDSLVGRETLRTFLPPHLLDLHRQHENQVLQAAAREWQTGGMDAFLRWFSEGSFPSGYYVGFALCREYLRRYGSIPLVTPSEQILASLQ